MAVNAWKDYVDNEQLVRRARERERAYSPGDARNLLENKRKYTKLKADLKKKCIWVDRYRDLCPGGANTK